MLLRRHSITSRPGILPRPLRIAMLGLGGLAGLLLVGIMAFVLFDHLYPPPLQAMEPVSVEVIDRDGDLLRAYTTPSGRWRLKADLDAVDEEFLTILLAYEDKRFWDHHGIDPLAVLRASWQLLTNGRIISGASTITMQLARLIEPRDHRTFAAKLLQMTRALQLEMRLSKREILTDYLTIAPYGGNLEGIRAASLAYFAKEPADLTLSQAALLVALPQSPVARRPDVHTQRAQDARDMVLQRMVDEGVLSQSEADRATSRDIAGLRHPMPKLAAHTGDRMMRTFPDRLRHNTTLSAPLQDRMEQVLRSGAERLPADLSAALIVADGQTGEILAEVGSPDYLSVARRGWIDMSRALRSPGSALKPFVYGLAFEEGIVRSETMITDGPVDFGGYRPRNFDMGYQGDVSIRDALLMSLNVPAVALLDAVGPARLVSRLKQNGVSIELPDAGNPGLAIGLGGLGITLKDLTQLYTGFVNGGRVHPLHETREGLADGPFRVPVIGPVAAWHVTDILKDARPPEGAAPQPIAYKTGTSYGYRDAWSIGYDGRYVIGVWVGKPDNSAVPGIAGRSAAAPILFDAFARLGLEATPFTTPPLGAKRETRADLPPSLRHFAIADNWLEDPTLPEPAPRISYPPGGAEIELTQIADGRMLPVTLKLQDGRPPFRWLANGQVFEANAHRRQISWQPDGAGQSTLTVIDAAGRASSVSIFLRLP